MGYYAIINPGNYPVECIYVERMEELVKIPGMNEKSIIVQGTYDNRPQQVGVSAVYQYLGKDWYKAGLRAQDAFARLAKARGLVLEKLSQDQESFKSYTKGIKGAVKLGDFLVRNHRNVEIEVTCRTFYGQGSQQYFFFSEEDLQKHLNRQETTRTSVIIAVFQRRDDQPLEKTLCTISVDNVKELTKTIKREKQDYGWVYRILVKDTVPGFDLFAEYDAIEQEEETDKVEMGYAPYIHPLEEAYVLVAYYKNSAHLNWIVRNGMYNFRMETGRGAISLGREEASAKYILLHTKGENRTGKLFRIMDDSPRIYSKDLLIRKKYPGIPAHDFYLVYKVVPVFEKELLNREWDITKFSGYLKGYNAALPFAVPYVDLLK